MNEIKTFDFELKEVTDAGVFEGYASTFGNVDLGGDRVIRGAFEKTLKKTKGQVPVLYQHRDPIGLGLEAAEDAKGLYVKGQLVLDVQLARDAHSLTKAGVIKSMSMGYRIPKNGAEWNETDEVRDLKEVDLIEYSLVTFPMNPRAAIRRMKGLGDMTERDFEEFLRDGGFSQREAKAIVAQGFRALKKSTVSSDRDDASGDDDSVAAVVQQLKEFSDELAVQVLGDSFHQMR